MVFMAGNSKRTQKGITLIGLGPGSPESVTREVWDWLMVLDTLYMRTKLLPITANLPGDMKLVCFDDIYGDLEDCKRVNKAIVEKILSLGRENPNGVTYAVPGHPFVAEATCPEIARRAEAEGIPVRVIDGLSFLEPTIRALGSDTITNLVLVDAVDLSIRQTPGFSPSSPALITQIYSKATAADVKLTLMSIYPDDHPVRLVHGAGTRDERVEDLPLNAIDQNQEKGLLCSLYVPPLSANASFESFQEIVARLRAPDGCPWDSEQTHQSLRPFLIEEAYEALDALEREDMSDLQEELGDLLLQIVLHAQIAAEDGDFNIHHVLDGIGSKLIRRHPHVFSDVVVEDVSGVIRTWESVKAEERRENGVEGKQGMLDGVPQALPALLQAEEVIERVKRSAFNRLEDIGNVSALKEGMSLIENAEGNQLEEVLGELLLVIASLAHTNGISPEDALRKKLMRFRVRFGRMEARALEAGSRLVELSAEEKEQLWEQAASDEEGREDL